MPYPFSGILVRFLPMESEKCCSYGRDSATEPQEKPPAHGDGQSEPQSTDEAAPGTTQQKGPKFLTEALPDELHVNLWEIGKTPASPFMDIGVMIGDRANTGHVVVDLPWAVEQKDISDLGSRLNGEKSVAAIFNEIVHYDGFAEGNFANISFRKNNNDEKPFSLLRLNSQHFTIIKIYLSDGSPASRLTVRIPPILKSVTAENIRKSAYIRFRIRNIPVEVYTSVFDQKDKALISSTIETRIVDFRINVRRGIPEELLSGDEKLYFPEFEKIHCFLTTERSEECVSQSSSYSGYRSLMDEDVWNEYVRLDSSTGISAENSVRNYLGYQWTAAAGKKLDTTGEKKKVKDLIVLARFSKVKSDATSIVRFIILVIVLGAAGSGSWELLGDLIKSEFSTFSRLCIFVSLAAMITSVGFVARKTMAYLKKVFS
ncbi:hypothetical protein ACTZGP_02000 [Pseudomonas putida]|uniref:hypothetical protein n=1 Tax=Pseudomonas TaxID=286 RepID=UPI0032095816